MSEQKPQIFNWRKYVNYEIAKVINDLNKHYGLQMKVSSNLNKIIDHFEKFLSHLPKTTQDKIDFVEEIIDIVEQAYENAGIVIPNPEKEKIASKLNFIGTDYEYLSDLFYYIVDKVYSHNIMKVSSELMYIYNNKT